MPQTDSLRRLGGGRWETRDGRFAIEPQSGTWVIVDNEQTDELGLPLVRGPFVSLTAAKDAIEAARTEGPKASPLADRLEQARASEKAPQASTKRPATRSSAHGGVSEGGPAAPEPAAPQPAPTGKPPKPQPAPPPEPRWLRDLDAPDRRRARDLIARLQRMGVEDPERVVRAEVADGEPALVRLAIGRALDKAVHGAKDTPAAVRAAVRAIVRGADVELGVGWQLVDDDGRRVEKVPLRE